MAWTDAKEREYQLLLKEEKRLLAEQEGMTLLNQVEARTAARAKPIAPPKQNFSITRMIGGAFQDIYNSVSDLAITAASNYAQSQATVFAIQRNDKAGIKATMNNKPFRAIEKKVQADAKVKVFEESRNTPEAIGRNITGFLVPFGAYGRAAGAFRTGLTLPARMGRSLAASTAVNLTAIDATKNNFANTLRDGFGMDIGALDAIAYEEDDTLLEGRLKAAISNLPVDIAAEGLFEVGMAAMRGYKASRQVSEEVADFKNAVKDDIVIKRTLIEEASATTADKEAKTIIGQAAKALDADDTVTATAGVTIDPNKLLDPAPTVTGKTLPDGKVAVKPSQVKPTPIETIEEFVDQVNKINGSIAGADGARLEKIARALVDDPHNALDSLSIDPLKLDMSTVKDPAKVKALQESLGNLVDEVAAKTGRTGKVISNVETLKAARLLAVSPRALGRLLESTKGLAGQLTAARIIVGSHANKLVASVDAAIAEISAGGRGAAWYKFVDDLAAHNNLLGVLRGAGSEIGRALQSLQMTVPMREAIDSVTSKAAKALTEDATADAVDAATKVVRKKAPLSSAERDFLTKLSEGRVDMDGMVQAAKAVGLTPKEMAKKLGLDWKEIKKVYDTEEAYNNLFKDLTTDAGRLRLLEQLKGAKGDLTALTRFTKSRNMTFLDRVDSVLAETKGNLFSLGTLGLNVTGGLMMVGMNTLARGLSAYGLGARYFTFRNEAVGRAAMKAGYKALAGVHAPTQAFGQAMSNAWQVLKKTGLDEGASILDSLNATKLAKTLQQASNESAANITKGVVKMDFTGPSKALYVSPEAINAITKEIEDWPIGRFGQLGLEWMVRLAALPVNIAGATTRTATSLFINTGDQAVGTISARIGAHTRAVDIAYDEAAEAGLEGVDLQDYVQARIFELSDHIEGLSDDAFEDGAREMMEQAGLDYAAHTTFSDGLETGVTKGLAAATEAIPIVGTLIIPFSRTPLRVMERTIIDYSPLGIFKDRVRKAWSEGDMEVRGEIAARYMLATAAVGLAWDLAGDRTIVGVDDGYKSSARYERQSYTLKIGDDIIEFGRFDPLGTLFGFVADVRQSMDAKEYDRRSVEEAGLAGATGDVVSDVVQSIIWSAMVNVLSKSWMESLEQLQAVAAIQNAEDAGEASKKFLNGLATRFVPGSGVQRQYEKWDDGIVRQSRTFFEGLIKGSFAASTLPEKLDPLFGRPIKVMAMERAIGLKGGPVTTNNVTKELARLNFDISPPKYKQRGVELSSAQYNRMLQLRGHETVAEGGTLEEKVTALVEDPEWDTLVDEEKIELIKKAAEPHTKLAVDQLLREDDDFAFRALRDETRKSFILEGRSRREADEETKTFARELGIKVPE